MKFLSHPRVETRISHMAKNRNCAVSLVRNICLTYFDFPVMSLDIPIQPFVLNFSDTIIFNSILKIFDKFLSSER
jgi:hypothetical protein